MKSPWLSPGIVTLLFCSDLRSSNVAARSRCALQWGRDSLFYAVAWLKHVSLQVFGQIRSYARDGPYSGSAKIVSAGAAMPGTATRGA
jgi:hypothetical protein